MCLLSFNLPIKLQNHFLPLILLYTIKNTMVSGSILSLDLIVSYILTIVINMSISFKILIKTGNLFKMTTSKTIFFNHLILHFSLPDIRFRVTFGNKITFEVFFRYIL